MDLRRLDCFVKVIAERSVTRAAERLHAPSAVSRQIGLLEHEVGRALFARRGRALVPTAEGLYLADRCHPILRDLALLKQDLAGFAESPAGLVRLGMPPSLRDVLTVPVLEHFTRAFPAVSVSLEEAMTMTLRDQVVASALDVAVLASIEPHKEMEMTSIARESLVLVGPPDAGLRMSSPVAATRLFDQPLICSQAGNSLRSLDKASQQSRRRATVQLEVNLAETLGALVAAGVGYGFLPSSGVYRMLASGEVSAAPVRGMTIDWVIVHRKTHVLSNAVLKLKEAISNCAAERIRASTWPTASAIGGVMRVDTLRSIGRR